MLKSFMSVVDTFHTAIDGDNREAAKAVIGQVNVNAIGKAGGTALTIAAEKGYSTMVEWLLTVGVDANIGKVRTIIGMSPCDVYLLCHDMPFFVIDCTRLNAHSSQYSY